MQARGIIPNVVLLIAAALLAHVALSWPLWYAAGGRTFPLLPVWGEAQVPISSGWDVLQISVFLLTIAAAGVFSSKKYAVPGFVAALLWMVVPDLNRLQPWTYFYLLALGLVAFSGNDESRAVRGLQWLLAAVYAWGGLNKITPYFAEDNFPWFCEAFAWTKPLGAYPVVGYAVAVAELLLAPGLLWKTSRRIFRWLALGFHACIVLALSPLGLDWNAVVIPWNIAMAGMVWLLFSGQKDFTAETRRRGDSFADAIKSPHRSAAALLLALAWIFPALNIWHRWDEPLSWKMYSNTQTEAGFFLENGAICPQLKLVWDKHAYDEGGKLLFDDWAFDNLHVPAYNRMRTHQHVAEYLCKCATDSTRSGLWRLRVQRWDHSKEHWEKIPCTALIR